ncbi:MAG: DUF4037 domain-containing protein [Anaerolineae bacterium]
MSSSSDSIDSFAAIRTVIDDFLPASKSLARGRYAFGIGGSFGKGTFDPSSDLDFRLYADEIPFTDAEFWAVIKPLVEKWGAQGIKVDGVWPRTTAVVDLALERYLEGDIQPEACIWAVWGYHLLPDLYYQRAIDDPTGIIAGWKARLTPYPARLKAAVLKKHLGSLRYWRRDYHYASKVDRQDPVFLAGLSAHLVHDLMQVLFALNEHYYVGDGSNLSFVSRFAHQPSDLVARVTRALYPPTGEHTFADQRDTLFGLIDEVEGRVKSLVK